MREWESHFTREYGWPVYAEYRHALLPHASDLDNAARVRAASAFTRPMPTAVGVPRAGSLPAAKSFIEIEPRGVHLSAFRKCAGSGFELRLIETEGLMQQGALRVDLPLKDVVETDLLGRKTSDVTRANDGRLEIPVGAWKIRTFSLRA